MSKSKDIRSFFNVSPKTSAQKQPSKTNGISDSKKKKRRIIESDSDEEPASPVVKKSKQNDDKKKPETSKYFAASAKDVFGSDPVKRVSRSPIKKKSKPKEVGIEEHDDAEFEAALLQIDVEKEWMDQKLSSGSTSCENGEASRSAKSPQKIKDSSSKPAGKKEEKKEDKPSSTDDTEINESNHVLKRSESPKKDVKKESPAKKNPGKESPVKKLEVSKNSPDLKAKAKLQAFAKSDSKSKTEISKEPPEKTKREGKDYSDTNGETKVEEKKVGSGKAVSPTVSPEKPKNACSSSSTQREIPSIVPVSDQLWVEKYKPTSVKQIVGQQGPKSCVAKLTNWLQNWHKNQFGGKKLARPSPWAKDDDGAYFKAALLSGRPGIGKTTTAHLVCKELGFDMVEFNASDTRSKKLLHEEVTELLSTKSLNPYFSGGKAVTSKHCLVMDEVDGMAGNEDRGGMQELIQLIKTSKVPIICMCNDRSHPKMRSLLNYCFDLSFSRPRVEQLRGALMSICFKEKLKLSKDILDNIITNCEQDIRLILNHLSMLAANKLNDLEALKKHVKLGPWDVLRKVFSAEDHKSMTIHDKSDLFFHDYSIAPLFVQENYLSVVPRIPETAKKSKRMELFADAAESISYGDLTDKVLRSTNSWSLLPTQAMFASVIPGTILEGYIGRQINFPAWLGKNSRRNKLDRFLQEIHQHTRLRISGSKQAINLDYLVPLRDLILQPLITNGAEGVPRTITALQNYDLVKEDLESILELSQWPNKKDPMTLIESKVKAALTRAYNKIGPACPYAIPGIKKGAKRGANDDLDELGIEEGDGEDPDDEEEKDTLGDDGMIVVKKTVKKGSEKASTSKADTSKGKTRGGASRGGKRGKK